MPSGFHHCGPVSAVDAGDFAEQHAGVFIDHHQSILAGDEEAVMGRIGHDVVPAAIPTQRVGMGDAVRGRRLRQESEVPAARARASITRCGMRISV